MLLAGSPELRQRDGRGPELEATPVTTDLRVTAHGTSIAILKKQSFFFLLGKTPVMEVSPRRWYTEALAPL